MHGQLTDEQTRTLRAAIDRIVPKDDFPSASEAGCLEFLLRLIELEHLEDTYRTGLDQLGPAFADLSVGEQDEQLRNVNGDFVEILARQTIEGYYSDPDNGGNKDRIAWTMVGFEVRN